MSASASSQLFPNISSITVSHFSYIIPYDQTQDCNIYGPLCQTGSITVRLNLSTADTTTILPCSSYLSAQSTHLVNDFGTDGPLYADDWRYYPELNEWAIKFGQSPECRSYANAIRPGQYTLPGCGGLDTLVQTGGLSASDYSTQLPPGIDRHYSPDGEVGNTCCGDCSLDIPKVRVYYFPYKTTNCHHNQTSKVTATLSDQNLEKRIHSLVADGSIAVISGHTL